MRASLALLPLVTLLSCATLPEPGGGGDNLPSAGAGPFRAASWEPDRSLILRRNEAYHQPGRPYLDGVEWLVSVPARSQRYKLEKGDLDFTHDLSASEAALFRASGVDIMEACRELRKNVETAQQVDGVGHRLDGQCARLPR